MKKNLRVQLLLITAVFSFGVFATEPQERAPGICSVLLETYKCAFQAPNLTEDQEAQYQAMLAKCDQELAFEQSCGENALENALEKVSQLQECVNQIPGCSPENHAIFLQQAETNCQEQVKAAEPAIKAFSDFSSRELPKVTGKFPQ